MGLPANVRGETFTLEQFARLSEAFVPEKIEEKRRGNMADYLVNLYDMDPSWSPESCRRQESPSAASSARIKER